jgi:carbamoylphosphate synthase large subunit
MKKILVTGVGGPAGKNVAALLLERGFSIIGTDMQALTGLKYAFIQVPAAKDPDFSRVIEQIVVQNGIDQIIPTVSEELPVFARMQGNNHPGLSILISPAQAVETSNDKYLTAAALSSHGIPVPRFVLPSQVYSARDIERLVGWPCISKPRVGRGGREVRLHTEPDLREILALNDMYILQEFASGTDYAPNVFAGENGASRVVVLEKTALKNGILGNALSVRRVEDAAVGATAQAAAKALDCRGPLDIDIRKRFDGTPVVLEVNARFGANIRFAPEILEAALQETEMAA